jgi:hypothetical protein
MPALIKSLEHLYNSGPCSLRNPYLQWLGERFIEPYGLSYDYFDFDPVSSFEEEGVYPVLVNPKIIPVKLSPELGEAAIKHQKEILKATSDRLLLVEISLDANLIPTIQPRRPLDERNADDRPLIDLVKSIQDSDSYFRVLQAGPGIAKMASDTFVRFVVENEGDGFLHSAIMNNDFDSAVSRFSTGIVNRSSSTL